MLTSQQIEQLFTFCRQHFVQYYDVQVELVDHLANAVEAEMELNPKLTFENALQKVHQSFGVMGFAPLVAEKQKMAEKQSRKLFWSLFKEQFRWPKIILFFLLIIIQLTIFSANISLMKWFALAIVLVGWPLYFRTIFGLQKITRESGKKFLLVNLSWMSSLILAPVYLVNYSFFSEVFIAPLHINKVILIANTSICLSVYIIFLIAVTQTVSAVRNNLYKSYPEVFSTVQ